MYIKKIYFPTLVRVAEKSLIITESTLFKEEIMKESSNSQKL